MNLTFGEHLQAFPNLTPSFTNPSNLLSSTNNRFRSFRSCIGPAVLQSLGPWQLLTLLGKCNSCFCSLVAQENGQQKWFHPKNHGISSRWWFGDPCEIQSQPPLKESPMILRAISVFPTSCKVDMHYFNDRKNHIGYRPPHICLSFEEHAWNIDMNLPLMWSCAFDVCTCLYHEII